MVKRTHAQWQTLFEEQQASGLSATAFCKQKNLCPKYFCLRRKQLTTDDTLPRKKSPFVKAQAPVASSADVRLRYRDASVDLSGFTINQVADLIRLLTA